MFEKRRVLIFETPIDVGQRELFLFHTDTNNLPKITPKGVEVTILQLPNVVKEGSIIELSIKQFGVAQKWVMRIAKFEPDASICDEAIRSPFSYFLHEREFIKVSESQTILRDRVSFELPLWPLSLLAMPFALKQFRDMFEFRHRVTKELLEMR